MSCSNVPDYMFITILYLIIDFIRDLTSVIPPLTVTNSYIL